jgi:hypothetical protein
LGGSQLRTLKIKWNIEPFALGYRITSKIENFNKMWDTITDTLETHRIFRIEDNGKTEKQQMLEQCQLALKDLHDKLEFIYKANSGLLDHDNVTIRFRA